MLATRMRLLLNSLILSLTCTAGGLVAAAPPDAVIAKEPLFSASARVPPNMVLDLSVEFPTTGTAYRGTFDWKNTYIGYWDPMACYTYTAAKGYFERSAVATKDASGAITCSAAWSGNLLNWAASSAIDMLRYAMTGGDRVVDTTSNTVLQRAVLQDDFYRNGSYFPAKSVRGNLNKLTPLVVTNGPNNGDTIYFNNCRDQLFIGTTESGSCAQPGTDQKYGPGLASMSYYARVEVCTAAESVTRTDLCLKYPNGTYKPVGSIQNYSEQMRFSAFGYLLDSVVGRYGGVLRAPMKYTGPKKLDSAFNKVTNTATEWNEDTGIFTTNPLNSTEPSPANGNRSLSGVVNYLNQFGRTGASPGTYKGFDPVSELYYESIRYLQGKAPTPNAVVNMTTAMKDGFPVYNNTESWGQGAQSNWDPVVASCQRNYVLAIGDLNTHRDKSLPGMSKGGSDGDFDRGYNDAIFEPNTMAWTGLVGAFENKESLSYTHPSGKSGLSTTGNSGPLAYNYRGGVLLSSGNIATVDTGSQYGSFGMAGMAYWANTQKIRSDYPDVRAQTFTIDVDEGGDGTIRQGKRGSAFYLAAKYGGFIDSNNDGNPYKASGGVGQPDIIGNSEWADGFDDDGYPKPANYFLASKPDQMIAAIRKIFQKAVTSSGTTAGGSISGNRVTSSGSSIYVPQFSGARWSGTLLSYALAYDATSGTVNKSDTPSWDAGAKLTGNPTATPAVAATNPSTRNIYTQLSSGSGVAFQFDQLDATLKGYLNTTPYTSPATSDSYGSDRVAYLRGDRMKELSVAGGIFRTRDSVMGDVVNSGPLFVGAPSASVQGSGYAAFVTANKNRKQAVYLGANDGMLHAFAADTGAELFAYVPRAVLPNLGAYSSPSYAHQPYVDGSPVAGEAQMSDSSWKTVLVSGTGGGARGVFALDVTNPAAFSAGKVMWEFTGADDADMGYVTQAPRILKFRTALATSTSAATYNWFAVVPSGFNNANPNKQTALFLLSLDKAPTAAWARGTNYYKVMLPTPAVSTVVNALSTPGDYAAADGSTRFLYAGDTQGNMWKFDFTKGAPWSESNALGLSGKPLIVAKDSSNNRQPITIAPEVGAGPNGGAILLFGTGKFVETDDLSNYKVQTMYGVLDTNGTASQTAIPETATRVQLKQRTATVDSTGQKLATISGDAFAYGNYSSTTASRRGWYFDFPGSLDQGERQISKVSLSDGYLVFNTLIPNANVCGAGGGGRSCAVNAMTGLSQGSTCVPSTIGLLSAPILIQEGEGAYSATDSFGRRSEVKKVAVINLGTGSGAGGAGVSITRPIGTGKVSQVAGRLNWRNVTNYKDVKP